MDGLSAAASAIAVVSLAVQIAESLRELCDFWDSIQEAPEDIKAILKLYVSSNSSSVIFEGLEISMASTHSRLLLLKVVLRKSCLLSLR
jgi:hypothetical protein